MARPKFRYSQNFFSNPFSPETIGMAGTSAIGAGVSIYSDNISIIINNLNIIKIALVCGGVSHVEFRYI